MTRGKSAKSVDSHFHLHFRLREGVLIIAFAASFFLLLSLATYHRADPGWSHFVSVSHIANAGGKTGAFLSDLALYLCGFLAYFFPVMMCYAAWLFYQHRHRQAETTLPLHWPFLMMRTLGFLCILIGGCGLLGLYVQHSFQNMPFSSGGILGNVMAEATLSAFNFVGATLVLLAAFSIGMTLFTGLSWFTLLENLGAATIFAVNSAYHWWQDQDWKGLSNFVQEKKARAEPVFAEDFLGEEDALGLPIKKATLIEKVAKRVVKLQPEADSLEEEVHKALAHPPRYKKSRIIPKLSLLDSAKKIKRAELSPSELEARSREVEQCLVDFSVQAKVVAVHPGPVVTRYELELAAGTKASKVSGLARDLARSLSVISVRIVEVIPGKAVIGMELPNQQREMVTLHDVLSSAQYQNARSPLTLALGKDISGHPVIVDVAKMPHLLVAGTTGSGKSVCLNAILLSLLYKSTPEQLRLILIDPKMLELSIYDNIPHLLTPVVTDMKDAATALRWCVVEMERRYRLMASLGVRNIAGYNAKILEAKEKGAPLLDPLIKNSELSEELQELPHIVVLADEFADMMVVVGKKVETLIARLAQKARAAGVHLILATQRPSVDVITGLIKANIPTRIAFQVSQKVDSRTILDQSGAEQLLGHGDMLYLAPGTGVPVRVHGAFVSDDEVHRVVEFLKTQGQPDYISSVLEDMSGETAGLFEGEFGGSVEVGDAEQDEFYDQAVEFVVQSHRVSISSIQRRFKIGYNRAARIVEAMEAAGLVSSMEGNGTREVLAPKPVEQN